MKRMKAFYAWLKTPQGQRILQALGAATRAFLHYLRRHKKDD